MEDAPRKCGVSRFNVELRDESFYSTGIEENI